MMAAELRLKQSYFAPEGGGGGGGGKVRGSRVYEGGDGSVSPRCKAELLPGSKPGFQKCLSKTAIKIFSACPDFATNLLQILIPATVYSLVCQEEEEAGFMKEMVGLFLTMAALHGGGVKQCYFTTGGEEVVPR